MRVLEQKERKSLQILIYVYFYIRVYNPAVNRHWEMTAVYLAWSACLVAISGNLFFLYIVSFEDLVLYAGTNRHTHNRSLAKKKSTMKY